MSIFINRLSITWKTRDLFNDLKIEISKLISRFSKISLKFGIIEIEFPTFFYNISMIFPYYGIAVITAACR
jgi:histidyl-tRNA synthetase